MNEITVSDLLRLMPEGQRCCIWSASYICVGVDSTAGEMLQELDEFILTSPARQIELTIFRRIMISID